MKKVPVFHPFFFAVYAVLGVYAQRPQELPIEWIIRPLVSLVGITIIVYWVSRKWTGDSQRAGLVATLFLAWFLIGHIRNALTSSLAFTLSVTQETILLTTWSILLIILGSRWLWEKVKIPELVTNFLNITSWVVILLPGYFAISFAIQTVQQTALIEMRASEQSVIRLPDSTETPRPDIYLIILDAYGREDFLKEVFHYDNSGFVDFLEAQGFYIAELSRPNYPQTQLSLASLLDADYLNGWIGGLENSNLREPLNERIRQNKVRQVMKEAGYTFVTIPNPTMISDIEDSDIYLTMTKVRLNQFESLILSTTVMDIFIRAWEIDLPVPSYDFHRRTIQYQLNTLKAAPSIPGPKFVFVHILAPHPPFVFNGNGNAMQPNTPYTLADGEAFPGTSKEYENGYSQELAYLNEQMKEVVTSILKNSKQQPIIIIQGDHGPGSRFRMLGLEYETCLWERYSILNAYYFPDQKYDLLYPSITPVNSFRVIFNTYFETDLPLLDDRNYYATYARPYQLIDITGSITSVCDPP